MTKKAIRVIVLSVVFLYSFSGLLRATTLPVGGGWQTFSWSGLGLISSPSDGYQLTALVPVEVRVVDGFNIGDQFSVYNPGLVLTTSTIDPSLDGIPSGEFTGDAAWADSKLSKGSFLVGAGLWQIDIYTIRLAKGFLGSAAFIEALPTVAPEPGTLMLLGSGLVALGGFIRRKISR